MEGLMRTAIVVFGVLSLLIIWVGVWIAGEYVGGHRERYKRYLAERDLLAPVLASDPAFAEVMVVEDTGRGGILLWGPVKGEAAFERLKTELQRLFGEPRTKDLLSGGMIYAQRETPVPKAK
jgi:hypothetical protein